MHRLIYSLLPQGVRSRLSTSSFHSYRVLGGICTTTQQQPHLTPVVDVNRMHERRLSLEIFDLDVGTVVEQHPYHFNITFSIALMRVGYE